MTYPIWDDHAPHHHPLSAPSPTRSTGNAAPHGDLRESVAILRESMARLEERHTGLEERHTGLSHYVYDRMRAHHDRLIIGDDKMGRLSQDAVETKRQVLANSESIATMRASHDDTHGQVSEMRAVAVSQAIAMENRREARKEIAKLLLWGIFIIVVLGVITGHIPKERLEALQYLKMLPGL